MFFDRSRNTGSSSFSDPYTTLPHNPRARRRSQPPNVIHGRDGSITPRASSQSVYTPPKRHSYPDTNTLHAPVPRIRFSSLPTPLPGEIQVGPDIKHETPFSAPQHSQYVDKLHRLPRVKYHPSNAGDRGYPKPELIHPRLPPPLIPLNINATSCAKLALHSDSSTPHHQTKPDPRLLLCDLKLLLRPGEQHIRDQLDVDDILALHDRDLMEREERTDVRRRARVLGEDGERNDELVVFGVTLREVSMYASTTAILGGREHDLPIVVFTCVEELYRRSIHRQHQNPFATFPNQTQLLHLSNLFDSGPSFGSNLSLHGESTSDICAVLKMYMASLPEPVLSSALFEGVWSWCVRPSLEREEEGNMDADEDDKWEDQDGGQGEASFQRPGVTISTREYQQNILRTDDLILIEENQIAIAALLLRLLPSANFSLMVYILAFFAQVEDGSQRSGIGIGYGDIGKIFGGAVFGGGGDKRNARAGRMMVWFLRRWNRVSEGLFHAELHGVGAGMYVESTADDGVSPRVRGWKASSVPLVESPEASPNLAIPHSSPQSDPSYTPTLQAPPISPPHRLVTPRSLIPRLNIKRKGKDVCQHLELLPPIQYTGPDLMPSDGLFEMGKINSERDSETTSIYSTPALDERLLDVALPLPVSNSFAFSNDRNPDDEPMSPSSDGDPSISDDSPSPDPDSPSAPATSLLVNAQLQIRQLERELERSDKAVADAIQQTFEAQDEARALKSQIRELEEESESRRGRAVDDWNAVVDGDKDEMRGQLEAMRKERDEARGLVEDMRRLLGNRLMA